MDAGTNADLASAILYMLFVHVLCAALGGALTAFLCRRFKKYGHPYKLRLAFSCVAIFVGLFFFPVISFCSGLFWIKRLKGQAHPMQPVQNPNQPGYGYPGYPYPPAPNGFGWQLVPLAQQVQQAPAPIVPQSAPQQTQQGSGIPPMPSSAPQQAQQAPTVPPMPPTAPASPATGTVSMAKQPSQPAAPQMTTTASGIPVTNKRGGNRAGISPFKK